MDKKKSSRNESPRINKLSPKTLDFNINNLCYAPYIKADNINNINNIKNIKKMPNFKLDN